MAMVALGWREGGCHCGAVRFRVRVTSSSVVRCNCSMCSKRADLQLIVPQSDFELVRGKRELSLYQFNTRVARHRFCRICGVHPFNAPRSHPDCVAVNVRCLDDGGATEFEVQNFDGQHWEQSIERLRA